MRLPDDEQSELFKMAVEKNQISAVARIIESGFKPNDDLISSAVQTALQAENDTLAIFLINIAKLKDWKAHFNLDFKLNDQSVLYYAVNKKNLGLVKALLNAEIDISDHKVIELAIENAAELDQNSIQILHLLIDSGANLKMVETWPIVSSLFELKSIIPSSLNLTNEPEEAILLRDYILDLIKKSKRKDIFAEMVGMPIFFEHNPDLIKKIIDSEGNEIIEMALLKMVYSISTGDYTSEDQLAEWLSFLKEQGLNLNQLVYYLIQEIPRHRNPIKEERDKRNKILIQPSLDNIANFDYGPPFLIEKLQIVPISQIHLNEALWMALNSIFIKEEDRLSYLAILLTAGANQSMGRYEYKGVTFPEDIKELKEKYGIQHDDYLAQEFFLYLAKNMKMKEISYMLDAGLRFKDEYLLALLQEMVNKAREQEKYSLAERLEPILIKEQNIFQAKQAFKAQKKNVSDWIDLQYELRPKLMSAIGRGNSEEVIHLIAQGADPNFGGDTMQNEYIAIKGALYNTKGITPSHFACMLDNEKTAIEMFQLLQDFGAKIHIINEYTQLNYSQNLYQLYANSPYDRLKVAILKAELNIPPVDEDPTLAKDARERELRLKISGIQPHHLKHFQYFIEDKEGKLADRNPNDQQKKPKIV